MGRRPNLSVEKRAQVIALRQVGYSYRPIGTLLNCSKSAASEAVRRYRESGSHTDRRGRGRPFISTRRDNRVLIHMAQQDHRRSAPYLRGQWNRFHGVRASVQTVRNRYEY